MGVHVQIVPYLAVINVDQNISYMEVNVLRSHNKIFMAVLNIKAKCLTFVSYAKEDSI